MHDYDGIYIYKVPYGAPQGKPLIHVSLSLLVNPINTLITWSVYCEQLEWKAWSGSSVEGEGGYSDGRFQETLKDSKREKRKVITARDTDMRGWPPLGVKEGMMYVWNSVSVQVSETRKSCGNDRKVLQTAPSLDHLPDIKA